MHPLKADREIVLAALNQDGRALYYVVKDLKFDRRAAKWLRALRYAAAADRDIGWCHSASIRA